MASPLAIDSSTPAIATQTNNTIAALTTGSFSPPAGSVLLVMWVGDALTNPSAPTITDNLGTHLTYTQGDWHAPPETPGRFGQSATWVAPVGAGGSMTVTVTSGSVSGERIAALCVIVLTGAALVTMFGAHGESGSTSASSIAQSYTAQANDAWGFIANCDFDQIGAETAGTGCTLIGSANVGTAITYGFLRRTNADDVNGNSNTLNVTIPGTSTNLMWTYIEVMPAAGFAAPGIPIPPHVFLEFAGAYADLMVSGGATTTPTTADTGNGPAGAAGYGAAVHVGSPPGLAAAGGAALATAVKKVAQTGLCAAGGAASAVAVKKQAQTGLVAAGAASSATAVKKQAQTGNSAAGAATLATEATKRARTGTASAGAASSATEATTRARTGIVAGGAAGFGPTQAQRAQVGSTSAGATGYGTTVKIAKPAGSSSSAGAASYASEVKKIAQTGRAAGGLTGWGIESQPPAFLVRIALDGDLSGHTTDGGLTGHTTEGALSGQTTDGGLSGHSTDGALSSTNLIG